MTNEEVIRRLENLTLPDIVLEDHRRELRASLLMEYSNIQAQSNRPDLFAWLKSRPIIWKTVLIISAAWALAALVLITTVLIPLSKPQSIPANVVEAVLSSKEVRAALGNDAMATATATEIGDQFLEVTVESQGGAIIIARVDTRNNAVKITEVTYIVLLGSIYEAEEPVIGEELQKVVDVAGQDKTFRDLLDRGAVVSKAVAIQSIAVTRHIDNGETKQNRERWAMVDLELQGNRYFFIVSIERNKVINRGSSRVVP